MKSCVIVARDSNKKFINHSTIHEAESVIAFSTGCPLLNLLNNGHCDDESNTANCFYDSGDCCGPIVETSHCLDCDCLDPTSNYGPNPSLQSENLSITMYYRSRQ